MVSEAAASSRRFPRLAKYEIVEEIGHGGMATVYRARDRRLGREVAVKVIHPHLRDSAEVVSRFNTEARAVAKLRHPNIVEVFDVSDAGEPEQYLVVELLRGTTLRKILQQHGPMPPEVAAAMAAELLSALAHASAAGVVHRDIKPENVLVEHTPRRPAGAGGTAETGGRTVVKLTDFGIAKLLDAQGVTSTGQVLGSPAHMAPEQIEGGDVDARADVFGMGVLLYECMVGHLPFEGNNPAQVLRRVLGGQYPEAQRERPVVGSRWSAILDRALAHLPAERFPGASAMRDAILAELARLGLEDPRGCLEAWLDEPEAFAAAHGPRMIEALCALAAAERRGGQAIAAAGDYNRALAHAPDDPRLLRIVAGIHRAEARARLARRAGLALVLMSGLGGAAFVVGRAVQPRPPQAAPALSALPVVSAAPVTPVASRAATTPTASAAQGPSIAPRPAPAPPAPSRPVERSLRLDLTPSMGVTVSVDGAAERGVATGDRLPLDGKPHTLSFSCPVCNPAQREVAAGEHDDALTVRLTIKPAILVINGDPNRTYQVVERPEVPVRTGSNSLALGSEFDRVTVRQIETGAIVGVRLHAGHAVEATF